MKMFCVNIDPKFKMTGFGSVGRDILSVILVPLNILDISRLSQTCKVLTHIGNLTSTGIEQKRRRMHEYVNIGSIMKSPSSHNLQFLSEFEKQKLLSEYVDTSTDTNPRKQFKKLVYLNQPDTLARKELLLTCSDMLRRFNTAFPVTVSDSDYYIGISVCTNNYSWYDYGMTGTFESGMFRLTGSLVGLYELDYALEKRESWLTRNKNDFILWLSTDFIKDLNLDPDRRDRINDLVIIGLGGPIPICPKLK